MYEMLDKRCSDEATMNEREANLPVGKAPRKSAGIVARGFVIVALLWW
jgi:hypothetical protein